MVLAGGCAEGERGGLVFKGDRVSFWEDGRVLEREGADGRTNGECA